MTQLFAHTKEDVDWKKEKINRNVMIITSHGGNLEKGTTELAKLVANHNHYNYYFFTVLNHTKFINENLSSKSPENKDNWSPDMYKFANVLNKAIKQIDSSGKDK